MGICDIVPRRRWQVLPVSACSCRGPCARVPVSPLLALSAWRYNSTPAFCSPWIGECTAAKQQLPLKHRTRHRMRPAGGRAYRLETAETAHVTRNSAVLLRERVPQRYCWRVCFVVGAKWDARHAFPRQPKQNSPCQVNSSRTRADFENWPPPGRFPSTRPDYVMRLLSRHPVRRSFPPRQTTQDKARQRQATPGRPQTAKQSTNQTEAKRSSFAFS